MKIAHAKPPNRFTTHHIMHEVTIRQTEHFTALDIPSDPHWFTVYDYVSV